MRCEICGDKREDDDLMIADLHVCSYCYEQNIEVEGGRKWNRK